jgi:hypothetical protein
MSWFPAAHGGRLVLLPRRQYTSGAALILCMLMGAISSACSDPREESVVPPTIDECEGLPSIELSASPSTVHVQGVATLRASGGSGRYAYSKTAGGSEGALRGERWIAGPTPGTDTLNVSDDCGNSASVEVRVTAAFSVTPVRATVTAGVSFQIQVVGTLGDVHFSAEELESSGSISPSGRYVAGPRDGLDRIAVSDSASGEEVLVQYRVDHSARLRGAPEHIALPTGTSITLQTADGSGEVTWSKLSGSGSLDDDVFSAASDASGVAILEARDLFTQQTARITVHILEELAHGGKPHGRLTDAANLVTGDFDGDGIADVALGVPESDIGRPTGGAVFIFKGAESGLPSAPTWVLSGETDTAQLGSVLAAGDLDGDGHDDLAISAPGADVTVADSGAVLLYKFGPDGPKALRGPLTGLGRGNFGASLAIADVDGDHDADLIVGSPGADLAASSTLKERGVVDVFLSSQGVAIPDLGSVRLGGSDLAADGTRKASASLRFGRAVAVADFNGDGRADLASLGAVNNTLIAGVAQAKNQSAVAVHFGRDASPMFADSPDLYILPANAADAAEGTWQMSTAPAADGGGMRLLLSANQLDSPDLSASGGSKSGANAGGAYLFDLSGRTVAESPAARPPQLGRNDAFARTWGDTSGMAAGRSATVADVDGDGTLELVLGAPNAANTDKVPLAGKLLVYPYASLTQGSQLNKPSDFRWGTKAVDTLGVAVAAWAPGTAAGLVAYAARASTSLGDFTGRLDAYLGKGALAAFSTTSVEIPARLASQQHGVAIEVGAVAGQLRTIVGMPGYSGAGAKNDGNEVGAGQALLYTHGRAASEIVHEGAAGSYTSNDKPAFGGRQIGSDVAMTDFNGDGRLDLVIAAPQLSTPLANNTEYARLDTACVTASAQANGGALVYLSQADGSFKEGFRVFAVTAISGCTPADSNNCKRSNLGRSIVGGFDFDGDGKQDLLLMRNNGLDIFLGRNPDDSQLAKPSMACNSAFTLPALAQNVSAPAALADLDADGCDEVAARYSDNTRSGLLVVFGFAAAGGHCGTHTQAAWLRVSGDSERGLNNMQLGVSATRAGKLLADKRDFVAVSAALYPFEGLQQPSVLLFDVAELAAKRPSMGEALVGALNDGLKPIALVNHERTPGFGRALAGNVDLDADGVVDLVVSAPGASINGDGTGAVFGFRGAAGMGGRMDPWLTVVGDAAERSAFGQDISLVAKTAQTSCALAIGAPLSYRTGTANGTAWLLTLEP